MATKTERLFEDVRRFDYEYSIARFVNPKDFVVKNNMNEKMGDTFEAYIVSRDIRDRYVIKYSCPIRKRENANGKILGMQLDYEEATWTLITRKDYVELKKGR